MALAVLVSLLAAVGGALLTRLWDRRATLGARLAAGYVLGTTLLGFVGYAGASTGMSLRAATLFAAIVVPFSAQAALLLGTDRIGGMRERLLLAARRYLRPPRRLRPRRVAYIAVWLLFAALFAYLFRGTFYVKDGGYWTDNHANFGDLPWHLALVQGFTIGHNYPPQHPEFAGVRLTYPFLVDFEAAQLVSLGASLPGAFLLQNVLMSLSLVTLLMRWAVIVTRRVGAALILPFLLVFSGGLGVALAWNDWQTSGQTLSAFLAALPHDYTNWVDKGLRWCNLTTCLLTTQRGLLIAIPLALMVWTLWWQVLQARKTDPLPYRRLATTGFLTGLLPLVHGHTFLMLFLVGGGLAIQDVWKSPARAKAWALCFGIALAMAVPQALLLASSSGSQGGKFFGWQPGWDKGSEPTLSFWWQNLGLFIPLLLAALLWRPGRASSPVPPRLLAYYAPFALCFAVPNLFRLAPWIWDNMKVLLYWHMASALLISSLLAQWWRRRRGGHLLGVTLLRRAAVLLLVLSMTGAGALDVLRIARGEARWGPVYEPEAVAFARAVEQATPPHAVFLCASAFDSPILLTGRREVYGYEGHLWSHGLDYLPRKADVQAMWAGQPGTPALLARYGIGYVVIGPAERRQADFPLNEAYWERYPVVVQSGAYTVYRAGLPSLPAPAELPSPPSPLPPRERGVQ